MGTKAHHDSVPSLIEKKSEKETVFYPLGLNIVWGSDSRYWHLPNKESTDEKVRQGPAELIQVCWLEVTASTTDVKEGKKYKVNFELSLKSDAFGWNGCNVYIMAKIGKKGKYKWKKISLNQDPNKATYPPEHDKLIVEVDKEEADRKLFFGLYEVWSGKWKGGLQIHQATVTQVD